jgi:hypothetical protein
MTVRFFKLTAAELGKACYAALCRRNQTKCARLNTCLRYCQEESKFFNDFSRARMRVRARGRPFGVERCAENRAALPNWTCITFSRVQPEDRTSRRT